MSTGQSTAPAGAALRLRTARGTPIGAPIHQSLVNPILVMGMERGPGISLIIVVVTLILGPGIHVYTIALAIPLLIVGTYALGRLAQYDPECEAILIRYATYDRVYDAESPLCGDESFWASVRHLSVLAGKPLAGPLRPCVPTPRKI